MQILSIYGVCFFLLLLLLKIGNLNSPVVYIYIQILGVQRIIKFIDYRNRWVCLAASVSCH